MSLLRPTIPSIVGIIFLTACFILFGPSFPGVTENLNTPGAPASNPMAQLKPPPISFNVKSFGVKGDGRADDSANIQKAFDSIKDNGTIYFPKGKYIIRRTIVIPSNIRIIGESKRSTILLYKGTDKAFISGDRSGKYGTGSYYITIEDIAFQGNDTGTGLYITSRYLTVNNVEVSHFAVGIDAQYCWTNKYYNVSIFYNTIGFKGGSFLNANSFVNCIFAAGQIAVTFTQGWNISFTGCQFEAFTGACFSFNEEAKSAIWNLSVTGCYFENSGKSIDAGLNCSFYGLNFSNNIVTTHGSQLAINVDNANGYGKNTGLVENNTFIRDNNGATEPFVRLNGPAYIMFRANQGYAAPGNQPIPVLDEMTRNTNTTYIEKNLGDGNRLTVSGTGVFDKGVIIGTNPPVAIDPGLIIYENGKLKLYQDSSSFEILQTVKSGPKENRPTDSPPGTMYFDTTLNRPIWWNGKDWVDANGGRRP
jgi:hypothetical protein